MEQTTSHIDRYRSTAVGGNECNLFPTQVSKPAPLARPAFVALCSHAIVGTTVATRSSTPDIVSIFIFSARKKVKGG